MEIWQKNKFVLLTLLAPGFVDFSFTRPNHVFKFQCSLLGLKQALRAWFNCLFSFLLCHGFFAFKSSASLFLYHRDDVCIFILVYVNYITVTNNNFQCVSSIISTLQSDFGCVDNHPATDVYAIFQSHNFI